MVQEPLEPEKWVDSDLEESTDEEEAEAEGEEGGNPGTPE